MRPVIAGKNYTFDFAGVPMEQALLPEQVSVMRSFLRAWLHYGKNYRDLSASKFLHSWRIAEFGQVKAMSTRGAHTKGDYKPRPCRNPECGVIFKPVGGPQLYCPACSTKRKLKRVTAAAGDTKPREIG